MATKAEKQSITYLLAIMFTDHLSAINP